ncbi:MAG: hypothetical protein H0W06_12525 [Chloroflexia bacterium]|nr:hypothetical protein [Chloroflexia bacterium]
MAERSARIEALKAERPDLRGEYESEVAASEAMRQVLISGPFPGIGAGHIDLYKAFGWRNWQLVRAEGRIGIVLPRAALTGAGTEAWRRDVLRSGTFSDVCIVTNTGQWVFGGVDGRYTIAFGVIARASDADTLALCGPFHSRAEFDRGRDALAVVPLSEFLSWTSTAMFPLIPDPISATVFRRMRQQPEFRTSGFRPVIELRPVEDRSRIDTNLERPAGPIPVLTGVSFNLWNPDHGEPYGYASESIIDHLLAKTIRTTSMAKSPFSGMSIHVAADLPVGKPRVAVRDVARATDSRTVIAALLPPRVAVMHAAPYLLRNGTDESDEAFVLGVLSSIPFDWYARRIVELHLTFELLGSMPVPAPDRSDPRRLRVIEIAGRLAAVDGRYFEWASAVGVPVGSVDDAEKPELIAELDALVSHLYGLKRDHVAHVFETFHRGWNYAPRLKKVLGYFDTIEATA